MSLSSLVARRWEQSARREGKSRGVGNKSKFGVCNMQSICVLFLNQERIFGILEEICLLLDVLLV